VRGRTALRAVTALTVLTVTHPAATVGDPGHGDERWGAQTRLALQNFPISGEPMPREVVRALAEIKLAAATVNQRHGIVSPEVADAIRTAASEVLAGGHDDQFPVDVFQTGSGTSTNMNVNEVLAHRASEITGTPVHPNDHVNASQSSNDAFPTAVRIAAGRLVTTRLIPALALLHRSLRALARQHHDTVKMARTHLMDAVPMTFGQEVDGWARSIELGVQRLTDTLPRLLELPIGGTAVGTGVNAPSGFGAEMARELARRSGLDVTEADDHLEAQSAHDALVELSSMTKVVALSVNKIAGDLRLLSSGPSGGLGELRLPELQAGSSIMPGKVNPVVPEAVQQVVAQVVGNDATITFGATSSTLQLNTAGPVIARAIVSSVSLLANAVDLLRERCVDGIQVDEARMSSLAARSPAIVTALAPLIGYDAAAEVVHRATAEGRTVSDVAVEVAATRGVDSDTVARATDPLAMTRRPQR
jgi:fumarate hydratase, class II